jgi:PAS domain S-box-containing protein
VLPSGRFSRVAVAIGLLLALLLVLDLELVRSLTTNLLISNSLDLAMVVLASICSYYAASRSYGYPRQLWLLLAAAFTLESFGQAISSYYQSFVPGAAQNPWPSDILFFVWAAPVFMIFLPLSDEDSSGIDFIRLLDFLQVAILALTLYLYFFYSPSRWQANQPALLRQILFVYIARDFLLALAFFFRSRSLVPSWFRNFSLVLSVVFLTLVLADIEYLLAIVDVRISAGWGDLLWMVPSFIIIVFAGNWNQPVSSRLSSSPSRLAGLLNAQILPIAIPLLVIFMGRAIVREQMFLAWLVVSASVLCSSVRLIHTNRRQHRIADHLLNTERALRSSEEILSTSFRNSPDAFSINAFPNGPYLELNEGFTRLTGYSREETLGKTPAQMDLWVDIERRDQALAALLKSGQLRDFEFRFRSKSGHIRIGQMSASIVELRGQRCSLVIVRDITERIEAESILRTSEERFRSLVRDLYFAVVLLTPGGVVEFANRAAHRMFDIPEGQGVGKHLTELGIFAVDEDGAPLPYEDHPVSYVLRTRTPIHDALMAFRRSGFDRIFWLFGSSVPQFDANGNIIRVINSFAEVTEMKNAERVVHNLSTRLLNLQDEERRRLGRELHDGLAQTVLAINLSLAQVRQSLTSTEQVAINSLEKARALTQQMSREIRTLSYLLHPPLLDDLGLVSTLKEYSQGFTERSGIETHFVADAPFDRLPQPLEIALFRIVQESLANIQRHSGSPTAEIRLTQQNSHLTLEVIDSGHGFFPNAEPRQRIAHEDTVSVHLEPRRTVPSQDNVTASREGTALAAPLNGENLRVLAPEGPRLGVGIPGMRERMAQLGGHLAIISGSTGTTVRATITLRPPLSTELVDDRSSHPGRG